MKNVLSKVIKSFLLILVLFIMNLDFKLNNFSMLLVEGLLQWQKLVILQALMGNLGI